MIPLEHHDEPRPAIDRLHQQRPYHAVIGTWKEPVALACSGGVDSTAMLLLAARALGNDQVAPFIVVHVDHKTRRQTVEDGRFVGSLARRLGIPFSSVSIDPASESDGGESPEAVLRERRYSALARSVGRLGLSGIVTAHTLDDQIETVLMRLLTGSGSLAAAGMAPVTALDTEFGSLHIQRPLLSVRRAELEQVLTAAGVEPRLDPSNADTSYRRNKLRHRILPALVDVDPGYDRALLRSVELASRDSDYCEVVAGEAYPSVVQEGQDHVSIDRSFLRTSHPAIASRILRQAIRPVIGDGLRELSFERVESVRTAAGGRTGAIIELPGNLEARIEREAVLISKRSDGERG